MLPLPPVEVPRRMELLRVPRNPVIIEVSAQDLIDRTSLLLHGMMLYPVQPFFQRGFCSAEALTLRLKHRLANGPIQAAGSINRKAQKRQPAPFMAPAIGAGSQIGLMGLLLRERETKLCQTRRKQCLHRVDASGLLKEQAKIIRVSDKCGLATKQRFDLPLEPKVHDVVEVNVGQ